ncbi:MAG: FAD-binding oxidoreductase [Bacteroidota bacterium]
MLKRTDPDAIAEFETDESGTVRACCVEAIYYPETAAEVAEVVREANERNVPLTVSGAGTGITGARVATSGGLVMSMTAMRRAQEPSEGPNTIQPAAWQLIERESYGQTYTIYLDAERGLVRVPAGMSLELLAQMLPDDLFYPPDPTEATATIGGTIATNASGARTFHYGATREWVQALEIVLPTGESLTITRGEVSESAGAFRVADHTVPVPQYQMPHVKNAAGLYARPGMDLIDLFIGCEGILGIVTEATLRLAPRPEETISEIAFFGSEEQALAFVADMRQAAGEGVPVLSLEYFDDNSLRFMQHPSVRGEHAAAVYTEIAGDMDQAEALLEALEAHEVAQDWFAETGEDRKEQREFRHSLPEGVNSYVRRHGSHKVGTDLVIPPDRFGEMIALYRLTGAEFAERCPHDQEHWLMFGHIGNYHLHFNFLARNTEELEVAGGLYARLAQAAIRMGGTISGEHGVGKKTIVIDGERVPYLQLMYGKDGLDQIAATKRALDPKWVLNPGNMVATER